MVSNAAIRTCRLALLLCMAALACSERTEPQDSRPVVAVSIAPLGYLVQRLAAPDLVQLIVMIPPGASPSTHEPTMRQLQMLSRATLYVKVGHPAFPFERTWLRRLLERTNLQVVDASQATTQQLEDPHLWTSPPVMRRLAAEVAAALRQLLPDQQQQIDQNLQQFEADVTKLDAQIRAILEEMPNRTFYVFHPAWSYFAAEYGLEQVAIEHRGAEPSPETLAHLIDRARAEDVRVIFVQPQFSRRSADQVAREIGGVVIALDPLDTNWLSNMQAVARALRKASH